MACKYGWYERFFYRMQLKEKNWFLFTVILILFLMLVQLLLTNKNFRKQVVLLERLEGDPVKIYKNFSLK